MFFPSNELLNFVSSGCSSVKMISCCLNTNLVLNLCAAVDLQLIITFATNYLHVIICICVAFLVYQLVHIYFFNSLWNIWL